MGRSSERLFCDVCVFDFVHSSTFSTKLHIKFGFSVVSTINLAEEYEN